MSGETNPKIRAYAESTAPAAMTPLAPAGGHHTSYDLVNLKADK